MNKESGAKSGTVTFLVIVFSALFIFFGNKICSNNTAESQEENEVYYTAVVTETFGINENETVYHSETGQLISETVHFKAELRNGDSKGKTVEATQQLDYMYAYVYDEVKVGDRIIVTSIYNFATNDYDWHFGGYNHIFALVLLVMLFFVLIVVVGRMKGLMTILALGVTALAIFMIYIPSILKGMNIYISTIIIGAFITLSSLLLLNGLDKKTLSAIVGNIGGLVVSGIIAAIMNAVLNITGLADEDFVSLMLFDAESKIDLVAVIWGGTVIGALGAIMDVAMSIASSMQELSDNMEKKSFKAMFKSGMNIGKDAIGTMTNTLILAYIGSSLVTVLLLVAYNKDLLYLFNIETIMIEVVQAISGSIGIICAVPLTTVFAAFVFTKNNS